MDDEFDFLRYLDFGTNPGGPSAAGATSNTFGAYGQGFNSNNAGSSAASSYASPQDRSAGTSEWSVSSPSGSNTSFPKSPLFGSINSIPSLFDSSFSWDPVMNSNNANSKTFNNMNNVPSQPPSMSSGNSPPFDLSIYGSSISSDDLGNANNATNASSNGQQTNGTNGFSNMSVNDSASSGLAQQWQQLLMQQAQLQLQMQLQSTLPPQQQQQQPTQAHQVSPMPQQHGQFSNIPQQQMTVQPNANGNMGMQSTPYIQPNAQFQMSTEHWSSRVQPTPAISQQPLPNGSNPSSSMQTGQQSTFAMMQNQQQQYQPQRSLSPTEIPPSMQVSKPIAALPKRESAGVAIMPTGAAQHVPSVKNSKIAKTGLKRSYQQVKQEDASDEENKRHAPSLSRSASAETSSGSNSGENDTKGEKKTSGGHNAVEQKYRRGINDSLITLREIVPALQHLRVLPGMEHAQRKQSQFSLSASITPAAPSGFVDGVMAPTKLSKQLILVTATDYIRFLQNRRQELEGELETYKQAITDCVEDAQVVIQLAESRWAPMRAQILRDREDIYRSRVASKEQSKKQAKLERQKNASARKTEPSANAAGDAGGDLAGGSDDDDEEDEDDDDDEMEGADMGASSALPTKTQAKPRGRKSANNKKASGPRKKASIARPSQTVNDGNSKALMSVFAGVSFVGGAGYDILFGSSAATAQTGETVSPGQVWSRGNILRRSANASVSPEAVQNLPAMQAFFLHRPALLSGLVMLSMGVLIGYLFLYVLPSLWNRVNGSAQEAKRARARLVLAEKIKNPSSVTVAEERKALATLSGISSSRIIHFLQLPLLLLNFIISLTFGNLPSHFDQSSDAGDDIEEAASSVRLLELSQDQHHIDRLVAFLHLFNLTRSSAWPATKSSIPLLSRAQAVLALSAPDVFGDKLGSSKSASTWRQAQDLLKKDDSSQGWLNFALQATFVEARGALPSPSQSGNPLYNVAETRAQSILAQAWPAIFTEVISATTFSTTSISSSMNASHAKKTAELDEIISSLPPSSPSFALALLGKGMQALAKNDKATAIKIALHLAPAHAESLASVRAFSALVAGHPEPASFMDAAPGIDTLAYSTISWLSIRQIAKTSLSTAATKRDSSSTAESDDEGPRLTEDEAGLQMATIRLRKLLATEAFSNNVDEAFVDAQDRCVEQLVNIGRQAAGLDALSDSGCEL